MEIKEKIRQIVVDAYDTWGYTQEFHEEVADKVLDLFGVMPSLPIVKDDYCIVPDDIAIEQALKTPALVKLFAISAVSNNEPCEVTFCLWTGLCGFKARTRCTYKGECEDRVKKAK